MLDLICASLTHDTHGEIRKRIKRLTAEGKRCYLIVPEQQTVLAEGDLSYILPGNAPLYFEVTNFTRFANTTFRTLGGISGEACDKTRKSLIMWRTLTELSGSLHMTDGGREINAGLVTGALRAIGEMQSEGITPSLLSEVATGELKEGHRRLWSKLSDLSLIYSLYKKLLGERYSDAGDDIELAIKKLCEHPDFLSDTEIIIEGFTSFTDPQYRLIALLAERTRVSVALPISKSRKDAFEYGEINLALEKLKAHARRNGADVKLSYLDGRRPTQRESISELVGRIWLKNQAFDNITLQNTDEIRIFEAKTPFEECDFICADIKRRVMNGAKYSDFAVIHASGAETVKSLESSLARHDLPAFLSKARDASTFEAIKLIYTAYAVLISGYRREDVLTYAKCGLAGISREACDELELYVNTWQISGRRFTDPDIWNMNPQGYTLRRPEGTDEKLLRIHETRMKLVSHLEFFRSAIENAKTLRDHAEALYSFLSEIGLESALDERARLLDSLGESEYAEENRRLWKTILDALDTLVEVSSDVPTTAEAFLAQLKIVFSGVSVGRIPARCDEITVGAADMLRLYSKKHVYIVGVNAGSFPAPPSDNSYFTEKDKEILSTVGLTLSPVLESQSSREMFILMRAIAYADESITFSYSKCNSRFKGIEPSSVIGTVAALCPDVKVVSVSELPLRDRLWFSEDALGIPESVSREDHGAIRGSLIRSGQSERLAITEGSVTGGRAELGEQIRREIYGEGLSLTETRITSFTSCPLSYFCKFVLKLSEEKTATFDASGIGSFIHAILEVFIKDIAERGDVAALTDSEKEELTRRAAESYIRELGEGSVEGSPMARIKLTRLCRAALPVVDALCDELLASAFRPTFFELPIGMGDGPDAIKIKAPDGTPVRIYGVIDRVDVFSEEGRTYLRVIDYKTGHKDFSPEDLHEGENLQMFLYLKSLVESDSPAFRERLGLAEGERAIPAGVIYVKTSVSDVKVKTPDDEAALALAKSSITREGMVMDDERVIEAMNLRYTPLYSARTPTSIPESKRNLLYSEEGWEELMETVEKSLLSVADRMRSGDVSPIPKEDSRGKTRCEYCRYKPICRSAVIK